MSGLRIAIDARSLRGEPTGVGRYTAALVTELPEVDPDLEVTLLAGGDLPAQPKSARLSVARRPGAAGNFLWSNVALRRALGARPCDVFHSPGYTLPFGLSVPSVVTLHDVSYAACPEWYPYRNDPLRRLWYRSSARRAGHVITDSEFSRREIRKIYGIPEDRVSRIYLGVDARRFRPVTDAARLEAVRLRHGLTAPYLLFVGDIHARRNVGRIIDAVGTLRGAGFPDLELVLAGRVLEPDGSIQPAWVRRIGYVADDDLPPLYSAARAFTFPSLYEGFGLGVVEAMACACPVIVSRATACDEVAGSAGMAVDPLDVRALAGAAAALLSNPDLVAARKEAGLRRAGQFTWRRAAEETLAVYRRVARKRP